MVIVHTPNAHWNVSVSFPRRKATRTYSNEGWDNRLTNFVRGRFIDRLHTVSRVKVWRRAIKLSRNSTQLIEFWIGQLVWYGFCEITQNVPG